MGRLKFQLEATASGSRARAGRFTTLNRQPLENGRILFLFEKIAKKIDTID